MTHMRSISKSKTTFLCLATALVSAAPSLASEVSTPERTTKMTAPHDFWNQYTALNSDTMSNSLLRALAEPQDLSEPIRVKNTQVHRLEDAARTAFMSRVIGKTAIEIERLYGTPSQKAGRTLGFEGVSQSQCLWVYYFGKYMHCPVGLVFDETGICQAVRVIGPEEMKSLLMSKLRLVAQAMGKTKAEIYALDPYPQSVTKRISDPSKTVLRYCCHSGSYSDLIFKDDVCVDTDSHTLSTFIVQVLE